MSGPLRHVYSERGVHEIAVEASPNGVVVIDDDGTIVYANSQLAAIFGYHGEDLLGASVEVLVPGSSRFTHTAHRDRFRETPQSRRMGVGRELTGRRKDGSEVPVEIGLTVTEGEGPRLVVASVVDISERKRLEREARQEMERRLSFERLIAELAARFIRTDPSRVDEAITESLGCIAESLDLDRGAVWQATPGKDMVLTHLWSRLETPPVQPITFKELVPYVHAEIERNEIVRFERIDDVPSERDRETMRRFGTKSAVVLPMSVDGHVFGALSFGTIARERGWDADILERLRLLAAVLAQTISRRESQLQLERALGEVQRLKDQLASENVQLRHEVRSLKAPRSIASDSPAIRNVLAQVESVAPTDATVLLLGETGSGKDVLAHAVHALSRRRDRSLVHVNCAAVPTALIESELFGRERGAYTGALSKQIGRFELANGSTIFLDEVGDLPLEAQVKLLRILEDRTLERLGSVRPIKVDVRVIAATNRDLQKAVADRTFREDLYYRLNVFPITVPPLRDRPEDIPALVWQFIDEFSSSLGKRIESISRDSLALFQRYPWPGNVRELRNVIERAVIVAQGPTLAVEPPGVPTGTGSEATSLADIEAEHIRSVLKRVGWRIRGRGGAAELLGMKPTTLDSRMAKLGIRRPKH